MGFLDWLFPKTCMSCGRWGGYVCSGCVNKLKKQDKQVCPMCNEPSMWGGVHAKCRRKWGMEGLVCVFEYRGVVRRMVGKIKYKGVTDMYRELVEVLVSLGEFEPLEKGGWVVVGVPLHKRRLSKRGFNQAEMLAEKLAGYFGWEYKAGLLKRERYTKPQVSLNRKGRLENVRGAFGMNEEMGGQIDRLKGRRVLIVDDVWTTGATLRECAKVLKRSGIGEVWGLVVAS